MKASPYKSQRFTKSSTTRLDKRKKTGKRGDLNRNSQHEMRVHAGMDRISVCGKMVKRGAK